jgi:hypothetical protein
VLRAAAAAAQNHERDRRQQESPMNGHEMCCPFEKSV